MNKILKVLAILCLFSLTFALQTQMKIPKINHNTIALEKGRMDIDEKGSLLGVFSLIQENEQRVNHKKNIRQSPLNMKNKPAIALSGNEMESEQ
jgi:hypothetical protein